MDNAPAFGDPRIGPASSTRLTDALETSLAFQRRWQRLSLAAYSFCTTGTLIASTAATYFASRNEGELAALLSAFTTVCIGLEKIFLFREKWKFHLGVATRLFVLRTEIAITSASEAEISNRFSEILSQYADGIPVAPRE